jgi:hypothetical protein
MFHSPACQSTSKPIGWSSYKANLPHVHALQALGGAGDALIGLEPVQLSRLWKALLLLRDDGVELPPQLMQVCVKGGG